MDEPIGFIILGEPASKANSRRLVRTKQGRSLFIKSQKAIDYVKGFKEQCPDLSPDIILTDVAVHIKIYYASRRPDLDESLILDAMEGLIYKNDRQVKEKHITWGLDRDNPRSIIKIRNL